MIVRLDNNTIIEINRNDYLTDNEYYKHLMKIMKNNTAKIENNKETTRKNINNIQKNDKKFIEKFL